jgi:hypothetical protein
MSDWISAYLDYEADCVAAQEAKRESERVSRELQARQRARDEGRDEGVKLVATPLAKAHLEDSLRRLFDVRGGELTDHVGKIVREFFRENPPSYRADFNPEARVHEVTVSLPSLHRRFRLVVAS